MDAVIAAMERMNRELEDKLRAALDLTLFEWHALPFSVQQALKEWYSREV